MIKYSSHLLLIFFTCLIFSTLHAQNAESEDLKEATIQLSEAKSGSDNTAIAEAHFQLGDLYQKQSQFIQARDHFLEGLSFLDSVNQAEKWALMHQELGDNYSRTGSFEEAIQAYQKPTRFFEAQNDFNRLGRVSAKTAFVWINKGDFDKAETILKQGFDYFAQAEEIDTSFLAGQYITMGILHAQKAEFDSAIASYQKAENLYRATDNRRGLMYIYNNMSGVYLTYGNNPKALESLQKTVKLAKEFNFQVGVVSGLSNIGMVYLGQKEYEQAIDYLEEGKEIANEMGDSAQLGRIINNIGNVYKALNDPQKALKNYEESLRLRESIDNKNGISSTNLAIGALHTDLGNYQLAKTHLETSRELSQQMGFQKGMTETYQELGRLALAQQQFAEAINWCEKGFNLAKEINFVEELEGTSICLATAYEENKQFKKALHFHKEYLAARDSLINQEQTKEITRLEMQYQFDNEKDRMKLQQERNEVVFNSQLNRQKLFRNASLGGLGAGLIILLLLYRGYRAKQKSNQLLEEQKNTIQKTLEDRETLLKEIHHRVKNNLQVVSSLLSLQSRTISDQVALDAIEEGRNRVKAMALIHQNLYQEENLVGVNLPIYIEKLSQSLLNSYQVGSKEIEIKREVDAMILDVDTLIPLGLILNELISNALKYAFKDRAKGAIEIEIKDQGEDLKVLVKDDGVGMPSNFQIATSESLGFKLVKSFADKMKAKMELISQNGTCISLLLPNSN